jgi:hypothetical protein
MKHGDLVRYHDLDGEYIIGVIISEPAPHEDYQSEAVEVWWPDDQATTHEPVSVLTSTEEEYDYITLLTGEEQ